MSAELKKDINIGVFPCFAIDLYSPEKIDIREFDKLMLEVAELQGLLVVCKFVVLNDRMYIFHPNINHGTALDEFRNAGLGSVPQSAGRVDTIPLGESVERIIGSHALTIPELDIDKSNKYQQTVIRASLGEYFSVLESGL